MDPIGRDVTHLTSKHPIDETQLAGQKIGLLGGSFNPAHDGHREISLAALNKLNLDAVWWLVTPGNPLKDKALYADYETRCREALEVADHSDIYISRFEKAHNTQYTTDTLTTIKTHYPDTDFIWLMGADNLAQFHRWRDWKAIAHTMPMAIMNRPDYSNDALSSEAMQFLDAYQVDCNMPETVWRNAAPTWVFIPDTDNEISSTQIRQARGIPKSSTSNTKTENDTPMTEQAPTLSRDIQSLDSFLDYHPAQSDFRRDVITGLSQPQKSLSPKYFYDEAGSVLFTKITTTKDYYPTRTELALMRHHLDDITAEIGAGSAIFEYGSGASEKIRMLIENLEQMQTYVAMDISKEYLLTSAQTIARDYPHLSVSAICADFNSRLTLPAEFHRDTARWTGYFPGSTIGNFPPGQATQFLSRASQTLGENAQFLLGFDLIKDKQILERAYNDSEGITAAFNLNVLSRMQRELDASINLDDFAHTAIYNEIDHRIEMHLRAVRATSISLDDHDFPFEEGETLLTEFSHKYTREIMEGMLAQTPWSLARFWTDENDYFAVCLLRN